MTPASWSVGVTPASWLHTTLAAYKTQGEEEPTSQRLLSDRKLVHNTCRGTAGGGWVLRSCSRAASTAAFQWHSREENRQKRSTRHGRTKVEVPPRLQQNTTGEVRVCRHTRQGNRTPKDIHPIPDTLLTGDGTSDACAMLL